MDVRHPQRPPPAVVAVDNIPVAHSWPKRRFDDWLNHTEWRSLRGGKGLQMSAFREVRRRAASCPTRPVTPEVAGSSPVAPVENTLFSFRRRAATAAAATASVGAAYGPVALGCCARISASARLAGVRGRYSNVKVRMTTCSRTKGPPGGLMPPCGLSDRTGANVSGSTYA